MSSKPKQPPKGEYIETETGNKISRLAQVVGAKHIVLAGKCVIQQGVVIRGDLIRPPTQPPKPSSSDALDPKSAAGASAKKPSQPSSIHLGRYVFVSPNCTLHPPSRMDRANKDAARQSPSPSSTATANATSTTTTTANATATHTLILTYYPLRIADYVFIGANSHIRAAEIRSHVHIGAGVTVGNFCVIKENVRVLDGAVLPPNSVWASNSVVAGSPARVVGEVAEGWGGAGSAGGSSGGTGGGAGVVGMGLGGEELVGVRARERWASVGNKR